MRSIANVTGFAFGLVIAALLFLAMLPRAHAEDGLKVPDYMAVLFAVKDNTIIGAKIIGLADTLEGCEHGIAADAGNAAQMQIPQGVTLRTACIQLHNTTTT
jgi:hypothetical protein